MAVQGVLWLASTYTSTLISVFLTGISYFSYQAATQLSSRSWVDPVPDTILPEKFLGHSQELNLGPLGWQSDVLSTIPNRRSEKQLVLPIKFIVSLGFPEITNNTENKQSSQWWKMSRDPKISWMHFCTNFLPEAEKLNDFIVKCSTLDTNQPTLWFKINYFYIREIQQKIANKIFSMKFHVFQLLVWNYSQNNAFYK